MPNTLKQQEIWTKAGPISAETYDEVELHRIEEHRSAAIGDPSALGLFGFGVGTTVIGFVISGFVPTTSMTASIPAVLVFAGVVQFIAGLFALVKGNTFAGTAFSSYGAGNVIVATYFWMNHYGLVGSTGADKLLLGIGLFCFAYISFVLGIAALHLNPTFVAIVWSLVPGYALAALPNAGGPAWVGYLGGYFLLLAALLAFYAGTAVVINSTHERDVVHLGHFRTER